jgi:ATP-binding cassette subfamily F protein 3
MPGEVILRFDEVVFEYAERKPILDEVCFSVREGAKLTLMGQNGSGKSTIFNLITGELTPTKGAVSIRNGATIGTAAQMINKTDLTLTVLEYFSRAFHEVPGNIKSQIAKVMTAVDLSVPLDWKVGNLSGGQQARLLLAFALIQNPDILLLDEPTNNLDAAGIDHLLAFLITYDKTVLVISHDADFLNCFTEGVVYLDVFTKKTETYVGDYYTVVAEIEERVEREIRKNAQLEKKILDNKEKVNFFANKGGKMRKLASKLKEEVAEMEANKVEVRREDKTIRDFTIPAQEIIGNIVTIQAVKIIQNHEPARREVEVVLRQHDRLLIVGPNGVGKSTLLRTLVNRTSADAVILPETRVGYYSQDFATLDYGETVFDSLKSALTERVDIETMRSIAAGFLLTGEFMGLKIAELSEGQKGLLCFARLVLQQPGLLILDEPTNHINFRHLPVIARAINAYEGTIVLVSHMPDFVKEIKFTRELDLGKL